MIPPIFTFDGKWIDEGGLIITITENLHFATLEYNTGRGPFTGFIIYLGTPVIDVNFDDGPQPEAGEQAGLMNFEGDAITWSNGTVWKRMLTNES